jgi:hypothetical protein
LRPFDDEPVVSFNVYPHQALDCNGAVATGARARDDLHVSPARCAPVVVSIALVAAAWLGSGRSTGLAQVFVRVRAETRIELDARRDGTTLWVRGTVRDDGGGAVSNRVVSVRARDEAGAVRLSERPTTDAAGRFEIRRPDLAATLAVEAVLPDEANLVGTSARIVLDRSRAHVVLVVELEQGARLSLDGPETRITVVAASAAGGAGLPLRVENELGTVVAEGRTDEQGRWSAQLDPRALGPPAAGRLVVRSGGDEARSPAQTEVPIVRYLPTELTWLDGASELGRDALVRARLATSTGPLRRRAVGVFAGGVHVGTHLTDDEGEVALRVDPAFFPDTGTIELVARFDSDAPWLASSESPPRSVVLARTSSLLPWLAGGSVLVAALTAWWMHRRPAQRARDVARPTLPGVTSGRAAVRRAILRDVDGRVVHAGTDEPLPNVQVSCGPARGVTDAAGAFALVVPDGTHALVVEAAGYEPLARRIASPHRGEWRGILVRLRSRRDLAEELVREVLAPLVPADAVGIATNRELLALARDARHPEIVALIEAAESVIYGQAPPSAADLEHLRALARRARPMPAPRVDGASTASL